MKLTLKEYLAAAFNARPFGMLVPPNWIGLGTFGVLGLINPGFWLVGAGCELAYLYALVTNSRFQWVIDAQKQAGQVKVWQNKIKETILQLEPEDQKKYCNLQIRCQEILKQTFAANDNASIKLQGEGLKRLIWIYLKLLLTRRSISKALHESEPVKSKESIESRIEKIENQLQNQGLNEELRKSLAGQIVILKQRLEKQHQAREKLAFIESELIRIQEQAELIREQAFFSTNSDLVSQHIDHISDTLGSTMEWIQEQQQIYGSIEDMGAEPPPIITEPQKEKQ